MASLHSGFSQGRAVPHRLAPHGRVAGLLGAVCEAEPDELLVDRRLRQLLGVTLAPAGLGVYLTRPPDEFDAAGRTGRWFASVEINFGAVEVGGNITPDAPANPAVPDPDAYRTALRNDVQNRGGVQSSTFVTQFYPFGSYHYVLVTTPVQIRAWKMLTPHDGIGFFVEGFPLMLEWNLAPGSTKTPAYGYSVVAGVSLMVF